MVPKIQWLEPWYEISDGSALEYELSLELIPGHILFGRRAVAIGRRNGRDDVLFWLPDEGNTVASVHLTWIGKPEQSTFFPGTEVFATPDDWIRETMVPDNQEARADVDSAPCGSTGETCHPTPAASFIPSQEDLRQASATRDDDVKIVIRFRGSPISSEEVVAVKALNGRMELWPGLSTKVLLRESKLRSFRVTERMPVLAAEWIRRWADELGLQVEVVPHNATIDSL